MFVMTFLDFWLWRAKKKSSILSLRNRVADQDRMRLVADYRSLQSAFSVSDSVLSLALKVLSSILAG